MRKQYKGGSDWLQGIATVMAAAKSRRGNGIGGG